MKVLLSLFALLFATTLPAQDAFPTPTLMDLDRAEVPLAERIGQGKPTVVAIWATWCQPCHIELDEFKAHAAEWAEQYDADVLAISIDKRHMVNRIQPLIDRKGWEYDVLVDTDDQLKTALGIRGIPQLYVLDGAGNIVKTFSGYESGRAAQVQRLLRKLAK